MSRLAGITLLLLGAAPPGEPAAEPPRRVALSATVVLGVVDRTAAADGLIAAAEARRGYFSLRTDDEVVLRLPAAVLDEVLGEVEGRGVVVSRSREAEDLGGQLDEQRTLLRSRQQVLGRYEAVLSSAAANAVVGVEAEMTSLVHDIESLQGSIQQMEHQLRFATLTVRFQFKDRRPPARDGTSSFGWLNTVNLQDLLWEFEHGP